MNNPELESHLFELVGKILTSWSTVEHSLCSIFISSCGAPVESNILYSAFWKIHSFEAKLKFTDATFLSAFPDHRRTEKIRSEWNSLKNQLIARNRIRNKIAHGAVVSTNKEVYFAPYSFAGDAIYHRQNGGLNKNDLNSVLESLYKDCAKIENFSFRIKKQKEKILESSKPLFPNPQGE